jgi:hypothetical protein
MGGYGGDDTVAALYCPCAQQHQIWGEFWWVAGKYRWMFFDDQERSETYTERIIYCPDCAKHLERRELNESKG